MNPVTKAITEAYFQIPPEILDIVFKNDSNTSGLFTTIDDQIMRRVITPRVLVDCNLVSGREVYVDVGACIVYEVDKLNTIIEVPKELTANMEIIQALSLVTNNSGIGYSDPGSLEGAVALMGGGVQYGEIAARLEVVGSNTILVYKDMYDIENTMMKVTVENGKNMSHLNAGTYPYFVKLVIFAIKAYIYNYFIIKLDRGYIYQGHELGIIKEIIASYEDQNEAYLEYMNVTWRKIALMDDPIAMSNYVSQMFSISG